MYKTAAGYSVKVIGGGVDAPNIHKAATVDPDEELQYKLFMACSWRFSLANAETDLRNFAEKHGLEKVPEEG